MKATDAVAAVRVTVTPLGAFGTVAGTKLLDGADGKLEPWAVLRGGGAGVRLAVGETRHDERARSADAGTAGAAVARRARRRVAGDGAATDVRGRGEGHRGGTVPSRRRDRRRRGGNCRRHEAVRRGRRRARALDVLRGDLAGVGLGVAQTGDDDRTACARVRAGDAAVRRSAGCGVAGDRAPAVARGRGERDEGRRISASCRADRRRCRAPSPVSAPRSTRTEASTGVAVASLLSSVARYCRYRLLGLAIVLPATAVQAPQLAPSADVRVYRSCAVVPAGVVVAASRFVHTTFAPASIVRDTNVHDAAKGDIWSQSTDTGVPSTTASLANGRIWSPIAIA